MKMQTRRARRTFSLLFKYWGDYGGLRALLRSTYLHAAVILSLISYNVWRSPVCDAGGTCSYWWDYGIGVLPNLLGFTLSGFSIFVAVGDERFRALLATPSKREPRKRTVYGEVCAGFLHFIVIQVLALCVALLGKSTWFYSDLFDSVREYLPFLNGFFGFLGYTLFIYSITSALAAALLVYRITDWYTLHQASQRRLERLQEQKDERIRRRKRFYEL